jgi:molybdopterin/thiamine biosynthesis adenylyltransferase
LQGDPTEEAWQMDGGDAVMTESGVLLWGEAGQSVLSRLTIGIAGLGGVGGIVAEHLARLGVGRLVLVDYDRLESGNFNRSQGATRSEAMARLPKVEVYTRVAKEAATSMGFDAHPFRKSAAEADGLKHLLDCDIIVGAADDAFARQVLDHAAYAHLVPVIDGGTALVPDSNMILIAGKSQVVAAGPAHACLECQGVYTQEEATIAREGSAWRNYIDAPASNRDGRSTQLRAPSVICNNGLVASLIGLRILAIALKLTPKTLCGTQRYYVEEGTLAWGAVTRCKVDCPKASWVGFGDSHCIPVGVDPRWKMIRENEAQGKGYAASL